MTTESYLLDTDIASYAIKGRSPCVQERLSALSPECVFISAVTRAEILYALLGLPAEHGLQRVARRFLDIVRCLAWDADAADHYAGIRRQLARDGAGIGEMDMMIAAHALSRDAMLVTNNQRHFGRIKAPLRLENWHD